MTDKPDNQMERWLEEYARRRQGELGVPLDMHEATRTMLQSEVSRKYGQPARTTPEPSGIPWLGWAFGGAAIGAVALIISINPGQPTAPKPLEVAKADPKPETGNVVKDEGEQQDGGRFKMAEAKQVGKNSGLARSNPRGPETGATTSGHSAPGSPGVSPTGPASFAKTGRNVGRPKVVQLPGAYYNSMRELRQEFAQRDVKSAKPKNPLPKPVLVSFQVERNGNHVRVLDQDGSIYEGTVINGEEFAAGEAELDQPNQPNEVGGLAGAAPPSAPAITIQKVKVIPIRVPRGQFYFRVTGTNKTLRKRVIIEATFDNPVEKKAVQARQEDPPAKSVASKMELKNRNIQAVRAIARMRVLGNARIEKANYRIDAYQRAPALPVAPSPAKPTEAKEK
jgi:hypothetical protein